MSKSGSYPASEFRLVKADQSKDAYWSKLWNAFPDAQGAASNRKGYRQVKEKIQTGDPYTDGYFEEEDYTKGVVYRYDPDVMERNMKEAVETLEKQKVRGITADVGFSQAFQESVKQMTNVAVMLSSLQQLSILVKLWNVDGNDNSQNKILIMTANSKTFDMNRLIPSGVNHDSLVVVGMEDSDFGRWVAEGRSFSRFKEDATDEASVEEGLVSMCTECKKAMDKIEKEGGKVVCIVQECAEMPSCSNGIRRRFNVPVYDTMTAISFVQMGTSFSPASAYMM